MSIDSVICYCTNGYAGFFSGTFDAEGWTDHLAEATRFDPTERPLAEQLAASFGAKVLSLEWVAGRHAATPPPIPCSAAEFVEWC